VGGQPLLLVHRVDFGLVAGLDLGPLGLEGGGEHVVVDCEHLRREMDTLGLEKQGGNIDLKQNHKLGQKHSFVKGGTRKAQMLLAHDASSLRNKAAPYPPRHKRIKVDNEQTDPPLSKTVLLWFFISCCVCRN